MVGTPSRQSIARSVALGPRAMRVEGMSPQADDSLRDYGLQSAGIKAKKLSKSRDVRPVSRGDEPAGRLGMAADAAGGVGRIHILPGAAISHERGDPGVIELVAAADRT